MYIKDKDFQSSCLYNLPELLSNYDKIYIMYGSGFLAKFIFNYIYEIGLGDKIKAFVVTTHAFNPSGIVLWQRFFKENYDQYSKLMTEVYGKELIEIEKFEAKSNELVLLAALKPDRNEMKNICQKLKIKNIIEIDLLDDVNYFQLAPRNEILLKCWYKASTDKDLNLDNPKTFKEKSQWLKLYDPKADLKPLLEDKYLVKEWIKEKLGEQYVVPLLGVWDNFDDIHFDSLPNRFVLKCNVGSATNIVVKDKSNFDIKIAKEKFDKWMILHTHTCLMGEKYKTVKRKIIADQYLENEKDDLWDYKLWCFDGKVKFIQLDRKRFTKHVQRFYSTDWEPLPFIIYNHTLDEEIIAKPSALNDIIDIAQKLAEDFIFVRVDLYVIKDRIYFGEMTFEPLNGVIRWRPEDMDVKLGNMINLKNI